MATVEPTQRNQEIFSKVEVFVDQHFAKIAFAISTFALAFFVPLQLFLGAASGLALRIYYEKNFVFNPEDRVVTIPNTVLTIVGATAALVQLTPAGGTGGLLFQSLPIVCSMAVGDTAYRTVKWFS